MTDDSNTSGRRMALHYSIPDDYASSGDIGNT